MPKNSLLVPTDLLLWLCETDKNSHNWSPVCFAYQTLYSVAKTLNMWFCLNKPHKDWSIAAGLRSYLFPGYIFASVLNNETSSPIASSLHWTGFMAFMDGCLRSAWGTLDEAFIYWDFSTKVFSYLEDSFSTYFLPLFLIPYAFDTHFGKKSFKYQHQKMSKRKGNHFTHLKYCQMILSTKVSVNSEIIKNSQVQGAVVVLRRFNYMFYPW